ncbi:RNMT-activating mini protein family-containing protein [Strongyloides ratti]|uniref:RNMT-activating mini protein family-containing protein n=1 Tax=Strongyloides ratti TaxID=34506 RepID=A0A090L1A8_STRRB|nr:RNMT-activating mini protein family-containing protein [Strongyloides ratti]CEF63491.1 RNMT-activating mini protein family-containing protein [Strongyloides ratti]
MSEEASFDSSDNSKVCSDVRCDEDTNEKSTLSPDNGKINQIKDNGNKKCAIEIVKTIPNNTTPESNPIIFQSKILEYERLFSNRYTDENAEYMHEFNKGITDPYISYNYGKKRFNRDNRSRQEYGNNRNYSNGRRNNDGRRYDNNERRYNRDQNYKYDRR